MSRVKTVCSVWLRSVKCCLVRKEKSLLWLCCLFQLQIQSFVLNCCFSPHGSESRPSSPSIGWAQLGPQKLIGWRAHQGAFGRFSFVYMPAEKTPITSVTLSNQTILSYPDRHMWVEVHTCTYREITKGLKTGQIQRLNLAVRLTIFNTEGTEMHISGLNTRILWFHCLIKLSKSNFWHKCWKSQKLQAWRRGLICLWVHGPVCVCSKTGSYILILSYKHLDLIHAPDLCLLHPNKPQGRKHLDPACGHLCHPFYKMQSGQRRNGALLWLKL